MGHSRKKILNSYIDSLSVNEVINRVRNTVEGRKKINIVFQNSLKFYQISQNSSLKAAMENSDMILADGVPTVWVSKLLGSKLPERVNGTDLFIRLLELSNYEGYKVFLLGATKENLERLVEKIKILFPRINLAGYRDGYFNEDEDDEIIAAINESKPDILFLGFGSPKKELWTYNYKERLNVRVIQGVGGSFDVVAGVIPRAPMWMQKCGLEWFYRVIQEPGRMYKRYLIANSYFIYLTIYSFIVEKILKIAKNVG